MWVFLCLLWWWHHILADSVWWNWIRVRNRSERRQKEKKRKQPSWYTPVVPNLGLRTLSRAHKINLRGHERIKEQHLDYFGLFPWKTRPFHLFMKNIPSSQRSLSVVEVLTGHTSPWWVLTYSHCFVFKGHEPNRVADDILNSGALTGRNLFNRKLIIILQKGGAKDSHSHRKQSPGTE